MKPTILAPLALVLPWAVLSACGEKHDVLGSRAAGGSSSGAAGSGAGTTGGSSPTGGSGASGGTAGKGSGGSGASAGKGGQGAGGSGTGGAGGGQAGTGESGGAGGTGGASGSGGSGDGGVTSGGSGGAGEAGASTGGTAGMSTAGAGGGSSLCPSACTPAGRGACMLGELSWNCGNGFDYDELVNAGCTDQGTALPRFCCPEEFYPDCGSCGSVTTLEACEARSDCHPVFTDPNDCGCLAIGCCARFASCADGQLVNCAGPVVCATPEPFCDDPAYVLSYANGCYEGCVKPEDCALN